MLKDRRRNKKKNRGLYARVLVIEAVDGTINEDTELYPEGKPEIRYEFEHRVNESWVLLCAVKPGESQRVGPGLAWVKPTGTAPMEGLAEHWAFNEDAALWDARDERPVHPSEEVQGRAAFMAQLAKGAGEE